MVYIVVHACGGTSVHVCGGTSVHLCGERSVGSGACVWREECR